MSGGGRGHRQPYTYHSLPFSTMCRLVGTETASGMVGIEKVGIQKVGIEKVGIEKVGIDKVGIPKGGVQKVAIQKVGIEKVAGISGRAGGGSSRNGFGEAGAEAHGGHRRG